MRWTAFWIALAAWLPTPCLAQPDYGLDWATIGDPGNPDATSDEFRFLGPQEIGGVDYVYRLTRTEVTVGQWLEYVNAYWPYQDGALDSLSFTSYWIQPLNPDPDPGEDPQYTVVLPGAEAFPANMSWYHAARFANWLHNGKASEQWAFEDGAYDTSTFGGVDGDGNPTDQPRHHPDARFWIPTLDEWTKGMYWDPSRDGPEQGGYWLMPDSGNEPLVAGPPAEGGETNASLGVYGDYIENLTRYFPAGTYPHSQSPWGLLDGSGGVREWNEDRSPDVFSDSRIWQGSWFDLEFFDREDRLDTLGIQSPTVPSLGFRLASLPTPATLSALLIMGIIPRRSR
ncbi:MAG: SUMF1/EgtB/PvdO family nonheme iron enzyme [Phycisphaeraceae bacterium]|nr:SUMF1/EgtB/PvdO family nonheme iron enzyme [Phycisphaeraceae bacterium]